jgi:hypothetical protein
MMPNIKQSETCYKKNPSLVCTELEDGAILLNLHTKYYYNLNETGLSIWKVLHEGSNISEIAEKIVDEYEVERDRALESVRRIMTELCEEGLVIAQ